MSSADTLILNIHTHKAINTMTVPIISAQRPTGDQFYQKSAMINAKISPIMNKHLRITIYEFHNNPIIHSIFTLLVITEKNL